MGCYVYQRSLSVGVWKDSPRQGLEAALWSALARTIQPLSDMQGVHISGLCFDLICRDLGWVGVEIMLPVADHSPLQLFRAILPRVDNGDPRGHDRLHDGDCSNILPYRRADIRHYHVNSAFIKVADDLPCTSFCFPMAQPKCTCVQTRPLSYE
jgi:hypothetical protein